MEHFNVNFYKFMAIVTGNQSAWQFEKDELDEVHRICAYYGLWDEGGFSFEDRRNSVSNLIAALQGIFKAKDVAPGSEENFKVDWNNFLSVVANNKSAYSFEQDELDEIHRACAYHGLWDEENSGFDDRRNSVSNLIAALQGMVESTAKIEAKNNQTKDETAETSEQTKWHISINNGPEQTFITKTGLYHLAVATALATLDYIPSEDGQDIVKIWVPELLPNYGPYYYIHNESQIISISNPYN